MATISHPFDRAVPERGRHSVSEAALARFSGGTARAAERLTRRQVDVLQLLAEGAQAAAIAARLGIAETTARNHIAGVLRRLGCHSQLEAVAEARRRGLL